MEPIDLLEWGMAIVLFSIMIGGVLFLVVVGVGSAFETMAPDAYRAVARRVERRINRWCGVHDAEDPENVVVIPSSKERIG